MAEVSLRQVVKRYGQAPVVQDFDHDIAHEEFVVLVGPYGCGKFTTLLMIAGLEDISDGEIQIGDRVVNDLLPRARNISAVFQKYALYPHMTLRENKAFGLKMAGRAKDEIAAASAAFDRPEAARRQMSTTSRPSSSASSGSPAGWCSTQPPARQSRRAQGRRPPGELRLDRHDHDGTLLLRLPHGGPGGGQAARLAGPRCSA